VPDLLLSDDRRDFPTAPYMPVIMINMFQANFQAFKLDRIKEKFTSHCWIGGQFFDNLSNLADWMVVMLFVCVLEDVMK